MPDTIAQQSDLSVASVPRESDIESRQVIDKEVRLLVGLAEDHRFGSSERYSHRLGKSPPDGSP